MSRLLNWLISYWFILVPNASQVSRDYINHIIRMILSHGWLHTIKRVKLYRLLVTKYMSGEPIHRVDMVIGLTKDGFPKALKGFKALIDSGDTRSIRFVLTHLSVSRAIEVTVAPSYDSITKDSTVDQDILSQIEGFIPKFAEWNDLPFYSGSWIKFDAHLSTKSGPQGLATWSAMKTAHLLPEWLINDIETFGGRNLSNYIRHVQSLGSYNVLAPVFKALGFNEAKTSIRKLSIVNDPEAKARVIAILDWFSQEALRPFHDYLFEILRNNLSQDRTFTQDPIIKDKQAGHKYHSLDLSSATDRFPISIQKMLVSYLCDNKEMAESWQRILTQLPYTTPEGDSIAYAVGQPMGAYSSWAVFTLSHHLIVQFAGLRCNIPNFKEYILLGDDIVIYNDQVASEYVSIINKIGAEISLQKTHTSTSCYEFAKRWFKDGIEVSGIPLRGFIENFDKYHIIYMNVKEIINRGFYPVFPITIPDLIYAYLRSDSHLKARQLSNLYNRITGLHAIDRYIHMEDLDTLRNYLNLRMPGGYTLPHSGLELEEFLAKAVRVSCDHILADNTARLTTYTNDLIDCIYSKAERVADQTNGWMPSIVDFGKLPVIAGVFNKMRTTVQTLSLPLDLKSIKECIKVLDFEDPERITSQRSSVRLIGSESHLIKHMLSELLFMANNDGRSRIVQISGQRAAIALNQMTRVASLLDPSNPRGRLQGLGIFQPESLTGFKELMKDNPLT